MSDADPRAEALLSTRDGRRAFVALALLTAHRAADCLSALVDILASADAAAHGDADLAPHVATSPHLAPAAQRSPVEQLFVDVSLVALDARSAWLRTSYGAADVDQARAFAAHTHRIAEAIFEAASSPTAERNPAAYLDVEAESFDRQAETCNPHLVTASRELAAARHIAARLVRAYLAGKSVDVLTAVRLTSSAEARAKLASDAAVGADEVLA